MTFAFDADSAPSTSRPWSWQQAQWTAPLFGGDYNPEQWTPAMGYEHEAIWREDIRLMKLAKVSLVTLGVFSWVSLQPDEDTFTFDWLDRILSLLAEAEIGVCLGTATAAQPAWLSQKYPEVLLVDPFGRRRQHGMRQNYCPTNPDFRRLARQLVTRLAERYGPHPTLQLWHVSNEYYGGATDQGLPCHCERCAATFREWLLQRYGSLDALNRAWVTPFWGHTYTDWEQILPPSPIGETSIQGLSLDFQRFISDTYLACFLNEAEVLRAITPHVPITTNFMGPFKGLDYHSWAPHLDIIAWDSYPTPDDQPSEIAFRHDVMRGLKRDVPWLLMEQTPGQVHWLPTNPMKRPGEVRRLSYQALAHGANSVMYFQWRQSRGSHEMYLSGMVGNGGHEHTRIFRETAHLGQELTHLGTTYLHSLPRARVAIVFSWANWWAVEYSTRPSQQVRYLEQVQQYYHALWERHIPVDIISPGESLAPYDLIIAPLWNLITAHEGDGIAQYVRAGGTFLTTFFSGVVDETARSWLGGPPGPLTDVLGIWVEEHDPLPPSQTNVVRFADIAGMPGGEFACSRWCDVIHLTQAQSRATYMQDYYRGYPAVTANHYGTGQAWYVATELDAAGTTYLINSLLDQLAISPPLEAPPLLEVTVRWHAQTPYYHLINHATDPITVPLDHPLHDLLTGKTHTEAITIAAGEVALLSLGTKDEQQKRGAVSHPTGRDYA